MGAAGPRLDLTKTGDCAGSTRQRSGERARLSVVPIIDPGGDVDGEPAEVVAANLAFSGVEPDPKLDPDCPVAATTS